MIRQIHDNIYLVLGANGGQFPFSNSILATGQGSALFDTGCGRDACHTVLRRFELDMVVNSHTHPDHFSGNLRFPGCPLLVPEMFAAMLPDLPRMSRRLAGGGEAAAQWVFMVREILEHEPVEPGAVYTEGDVIDLGPLKLEAIHTPGHLEDHFCFFERDQGILLSFDLDLSPFGPWYGHAESDLPVLRNSLRRLSGLRPRMVISSHLADPIEGEEVIQARFESYEAVIDRRHEHLLSLLPGEGATPEELAEGSPIYGLRAGRGFALYHYFEARMIEKHLQVAADQGLATRHPDGRYFLD